MRIAAASENDLDAAFAIIVACREALEAQGLLQWDAQYPSRAFFAEAIAQRNLFVLRNGDRIEGVVVLNEWQPPEWSAADWHEQEAHPLVVHAFAIAPQIQGHGHGRALLTFCEDFARDQGYTSIRLDAFPENAIALRFYERHGYVFRGAIHFASKPVGHQEYFCYEKALSAPVARGEGG
ncbi:MAG TPA: GNAT family N-acetyltransferase [Paraburkholderia sp.]|uniref:GNAT family N-acetyltransferase n=1 Tax=Paraburkholderia sp. TaxID=1926495 RepID=UPI002B45B0C2|nr:GNAT family N-acetyltransferase [Paraburkholderia sp.]HKR43032.1 GNAT family N-acetyltransferase [Paraburkholderia sp.]